MAGKITKLLKAEYEELGPITYVTFRDPEGGQCVRPTSLEKHKSIGFLRNTGPDSLEYHKASQLAFNAGPSWSRQQKKKHLIFMLMR